MDDGDSEQPATGDLLPAYKHNPIIFDSPKVPVRRSGSRLVYFILRLPIPSLSPIPPAFSPNIPYPRQPDVSSIHVLLAIKLSSLINTISNLPNDGDPPTTDATNF